MNKNTHPPVNEYVVTALVTIILIFSISLLIQMQLYFNIETIINKREFAMRNLVKFYNIEQLENMSKADPGNYMILINLAKAYESIEQYKTSDKLYKDALNLSKHSDYALYSYAIFCAKMGWHSIACDIAEEFDLSKRKIAYKYKAEIYNELAKNFDKNQEYEAAVKSYQVAYKYAKNIRNSKFLKKISTDYAKEFVKLADYNIEQGNVKDALLNLENSLAIKELDIAKYKLALINKDVDKVTSEIYFHDVFKSSPYLINPYIYNDLLVSLINESKNYSPQKADFYSVRLNNLKSKMQEYYIYKGDVLFSKSHVNTYKKFLNNKKRYTLCFDIKNNTKISLNNLFIKAEIIINKNTYKIEKKVINSSSPLESYDELKNAELDLPSEISFQDSNKKIKKNEIIAKYYVKKQKKAPWTLAKIELIKF